MSTNQEEYEETVAPISQWLTFVLGNEKYAVKVVQVQEVLRYTSIVPVSGAPTDVLGIINLGGNVVTLVDTVTEVIDLKDKEVETTPDAGNSVYSLFIQGIANINNVLHILVNFNKLLTVKELELLTD